MRIARSGARFDGWADAAVIAGPIVVFGVALAARLRLAWESIDDILLKSTPDDGYYYLTIARNIAHGRNVTFDGTTVTNGFHPLWLAMITPVFWFVHGEQMPIHAVLTMGAVLGALTAALIFIIVVRMTGNAVAAAIAGLAFALHPNAMRDSVTGVETPIELFMLAVVVLMYVRMFSATATRRQDLLFGAACGLLLLARTDTIFVVGAIMAALIVRTPRGDRIRRTGRLGGATLLVLAPWVAWTLAANGTIVQVSGVAGAWQYQHAYLAAHGDNLLTRISHGAWFTKLMFRGVLAHQYAVVPGHSGWPLAAGALAIGALMLAAPRPDGHGNARMLLLMLAVPIAGFLLGVVYHAGIRWHLRSWYLSPASVFLALLLGVGIDYLAKCARGLARRIDATARVRLVAVLPAALYVVAGAWLWRTYQPNHDERFVLPFQFQLNVLAGARWIEGHTPPNARVGAYNAGVIGYFSHRDVVNLDGVVNADALSALQDCRSGDYIREMRIAYLADLQDWLTPAKCGDNVPTYTTLATLGRRQTYFGGALVDIWQVSTGPP